MNRRPRSPVVIYPLVLALIFAGMGWGCGKHKEAVPPGGGSPTVTASNEQGITIHLTADTDWKKNPDPRNCGLSKGQVPDRDHVRWQNDTGHPITLTFTGPWPFLEKPQAPIVLQTGELSPYYTLDRNLPAMSYPYQGSPALPSGPPGEPTIDGGP